VVGKRLCGRSMDLYAVGVVVLSVSALTDVLTPWVIGNLISASDLHLTVPALLIAFTAALKSTLFPIVHHLGSSAQGRTSDDRYPRFTSATSLAPPLALW